jgi:hypothetical protein
MCFVNFFVGTFLGDSAEKCLNSSRFYQCLYYCCTFIVRSAF